MLVRWAIFRWLRIESTGYTRPHSRHRHRQLSSKLSTNSLGDKWSGSGDRSGTPTAFRTSEELGAATSVSGRPEGSSESGFRSVSVRLLATSSVFVTSAESAGWRRTRRFVDDAGRRPRRPGCGFFFLATGSVVEAGADDRRPTADRLEEVRYAVR